MLNSQLFYIVSAMQLALTFPVFAEEPCFAHSQWLCKVASDRMVLSRTYFLLADQGHVEGEHHLFKRAELIALGDIQRLIDGVLSFDAASIEFLSSLCNVDSLELALASIRTKNMSAQQLCKHEQSILIGVEVDVFMAE